MTWQKNYRPLKYNTNQLNRFMRKYIFDWILCHTVTRWPYKCTVQIYQSKPISMLHSSGNADGDGGNIEPNICCQTNTPFDIWFIANIPMPQKKKRKEKENLEQISRMKYEILIVYSNDVWCNSVTVETSLLYQCWTSKELSSIWCSCESFFFCFLAFASCLWMRRYRVCVYA